MYNFNLLTRFMNYYQNKGFWQTIRRLFEEPYMIIFKSNMILIYAELNEVNDSVLTLPPGIRIECKKTYNDAVQSDMQTMIDYWNKGNAMNNVREKFKKGATLWILKINEDIGGCAWAIRSTMPSAYPLPLTPNDAIIFTAETFEKYRGRGFYALLMNYILRQLKLEGLSRVYGYLWSENKPVISAVRRTYFHKFCEVRMFHLFGKNITIYNN